jgi:hypothetical protein
MLGEGLANALSHPAMDLVFECQPVDDGADIVDDDIAQHLRRTGLGIDPISPATTITLLETLVNLTQAD